jgi:hypothetical protein
VLLYERPTASFTGKFRRLIVPGRGDWFTTRPRHFRA